MREPRLWGETHLAVAQAAVFRAGERGDGTADVACAEADAGGEVQVETQSLEAAFFRTQHAQPDVAERHLPVSADGAVRVPDWIHRRPFPLYHGAGSLPDHDGGERAGGLPAGDGDVWCAQGNADGQRSAVHQLARQDALRARTAERPGAPHPEQSPPPDDAG